MVSKVSGEANMLKGFYAYRDRFQEDAVWVEIPRDGKSNAAVGFSLY